MARSNTEERQTQIINEAILIIHEQGYQALAIRELAGRVGVSEPALYRHFENKEGIILGILNRMWQQGLLLEKQLAGFSNPKEKFRNLISMQLDYLEKHPQMTSVVFSEEIFRHSDSLSRKMEQVIDYRLLLIKRLIDESKSRYTVVDVPTDELSIIILGSVRMAVRAWRCANFSYSLRKKGKRLLDTLDNMIFVRTE